MFNHLEVKLGKLAAVVDSRTLMLATYANPAALPPVKPTVKRSNLVPVGTWGMMANNEYGDCTCAAMGHGVQITSAAVSDGKTILSPSNNEILQAYWATGNPPNNPCPPGGATDDGRAELTVLKYWQQVGLDGKKAEAFVGLNPQDTNWNQTKYAIDLFGFAYIGVLLPLSAQGQSMWTVTSGPGSEAGSWGGHAVVLVDYDSQGPTCVTWGQTLKMTWSFYRAYVDEAYAVILPEWFNAQGADPEGFNLAALQADLAAITSA